MLGVMRQLFRAALLLAIVVVGGAAAGAAEKVERIAKLTAIQGEVLVQKAGGSKPFKAFVNLPVAKGDQIMTGKGGSVQLVLDDGSKLTLGSQTHILLSDYTVNPQGGKKTVIKVMAGQVWSKLQSLTNANDSFQFETPTAVMGIRGTMLLIEKSRVWVAEGAVAVRGIGPESQSGLVLANERVQIRRGGQLRGEVIQADRLAKAMDVHVLREAVSDIVRAVQDTATRPVLNKMGNNMANSFLQQSLAFVQAAAKEEPSLTIPEGFPKAADDVAQKVKAFSTHPDNPNPRDSVTSENGIKDQPGGSTPTGGAGSGGGSGGGSSGDDDDDDKPGGGGGGGGGGNPQGNPLPRIESASNEFLANGEVSRITLIGKHTAFTQKQPVIQLPASEWGTSEIRQLQVLNDTTITFEVTAPEDGQYPITVLHDKRTLNTSVTISGGPARITTVSRVESKEDLWLRIHGRNLQLNPQQLSVTLYGEADNLAYPLSPIQNVHKREVTAGVPAAVPSGRYRLELTSGSNLYRYAPIEIMPRPLVEALMITPSQAEIFVGESLSLQVTARYSNGKIRDVTDQAVWLTDHPQIASVSAGAVTGQAPGTTNVRASFSGKDISATLIVKEQQVPPPPATVVSLQIKGTDPASGNIELQTGNHKQLSLEATMSDGTIQPVATGAKWQVADPAVATVSPTGEIKGLAAGVTTLHAAYAGKSTSVPVRVTEPESPGWPAIHYLLAQERPGKKLEINGSVFYADKARVTLRAVNGETEYPPVELDVDENGKFYYLSDSLEDGVWEYTVEAIRGSDVSHPAVVPLPIGNVTPQPVPAAIGLYDFSFNRTDLVTVADMTANSRLRLYDTTRGGSPLGEVIATHDGQVSLSIPGGLPEGPVYVTIQEPERAESMRLEITHAETTPSLVMEQIAPRPVEGSIDIHGLQHGDMASVYGMDGTLHARQRADASIAGPFSLELPAEAFTDGYQVTVTAINKKESDPLTIPGDNGLHLVSSSVEEGDTDVSFASPIVLDFDDPLEIANPAGVLIVEDGGSPVAVHSVTKETDNGISIQHDPFIPGRTYKLTVATGTVRSLFGQENEEIIISFTASSLAPPVEHLHLERGDWLDTIRVVALDHAITGHAAADHYVYSILPENGAAVEVHYGQPLPDIGAWSDVAAGDSIYGRIGDQVAFAALDHTNAIVAWRVISLTDQEVRRAAVMDSVIEYHGEENMTVAELLDQVDDYGFTSIEVYHPDTPAQLSSGMDALVQLEDGHYERFKIMEDPNLPEGGLHLDADTLLITYAGTVTPDDLQASAGELGATYIQIVSAVSSEELVREELLLRMVLTEGRIYWLDDVSNNV